MQKFDVQIALEGIHEARHKWGVAQREFQKNLDMVMSRLIHEAAANYMSVVEVSRVSGMTTHRVRGIMRQNGLNPHSNKTLLAEQAAKALAVNAELMGVKPHEMDLTSPLAYLPMGSELRQQLTDKTVSQVHEVPDDEEVSRNAHEALSRLTDQAVHTAGSDEGLARVYEDFTTVTVALGPVR